MKFRNILILAALAPFLLAAPPVAQGAPKPVMVHYMPWFVSKPYSGSWGWHWTMNYFNPDLPPDVNGELQIASWYYPLIGPYDSLDPAVLEYHVLLMKLAGIDGVIVDWYGQDNYYDYSVNNQRTVALLNYARKAGLKFSLCYEDATIQAEIRGGSMNGVNTATNPIAHAQQTMLYAQTQFFTDSSYLRLNNAPVLLNFGPQYFHNSSDWTSIFSVLNATNQPAFFTEDNRLSPVGWGAFDWPPMWQSSGNPLTLSSNQLQNYLVNFETTAKNQAWPSYVSSAFPRFHDIYGQVPGNTSYGHLDDANGSTLTSTLRRAMTNSSAIVQIVTWNDFGEGTVVEPTAAGNEPTTEYGYSDLGIIQDSRRQYLDSTFPYHTNDLALAFRFYNLRKQYGNNPANASELNRIFTNIVSGQVATANLELTGMESNHPVIYNLSYGGSQLQFLIGGYVASAVQVQMSTNLIDWQAVQTFPASANLSVFSTSNALDVCRFFQSPIVVAADCLRLLDWPAIGRNEFPRIALLPEFD